MWCDSAGCRTIEGSRGNVHSWGDNGRWSIFLDDRADGYDDQERKLLVFMQPGYSPNKIRTAATLSRAPADAGGGRGGARGIGHAHRGEEAVAARRRMNMTTSPV